MQQLTVAGLQLEYRDFPATRHGGPTLLLLHEGLGSLSMWGGFPERLAAATGCRLLVWSRAGHGGSAAYAEPRTPRYLHREAEEALPALLTAFGIQRPVLIGHSDGGSIALLFAAAFPEVPLGVAVLAPHEFVEEVTLTGVHAAGETWATTAWPQRLARHHADAPRVFRDWYNIWLAPEFRAWNIESCLSLIRCPVLALQGEDDEYGTARQVTAIGERVPGARIQLLPACGHAPHRDQEAAVLAALVAFIDHLTAS